MGKETKMKENNTISNTLLKFHNKITNKKNKINLNHIIFFL